MLETKKREGTYKERRRNKYGNGGGGVEEEGVFIFNFNFTIDYLSAASPGS